MVTIILQTLLVCLVILFIAKLSIDIWLHKQIKKLKMVNLAPFLTVLLADDKFSKNKIKSNPEMTKTVIAVGVEHVLMLEIKQLDRENYQLSVNIAAPSMPEVLTKAKTKIELNKIAKKLATRKEMNIQERLAELVLILQELDKEYKDTHRQVPDSLL